MPTLSPSFELIGELVEIDIKSPTASDPTPAALAMVRYGPERTWRNDVDTNFVNEIYVRLIFNTYSKSVDKFQPGVLLRIKGRLQSVQKTGEDFPRVELVGEIVHIPISVGGR